jgi:hypothetical protein
MEDIIAAFLEKKDVQTMYKPSRKKEIKVVDQMNFALQRLVSRHRNWFDQSDRLGQERNSAVRKLYMKQVIMMKASLEMKFYEHETNK